MNITFTYPRADFERWEAEGVNTKDLIILVNKHRTNLLPALDKCFRYYEGYHAIDGRTRREPDAPNNKPVCNHAKDIADTSSGYFIGSPVSYGKATDGADLRGILQAFDTANVDDADQENSLNLAITGRAYDYTYVKEGLVELQVMSLDPRNVFVVRDETIQHDELFAVYYYYKDNTEKANIVTAGSRQQGPRLVLTLMTADRIYTFEGVDTDIKLVDTQTHNLGAVPVTEYRNNKLCIGDFEQQIGLIDAYNNLMADRVNDKAQFIDAILVIYGALLGDDEEETDKAWNELKKKKLLELPQDGARAEYLTRTFDETSVETLRKALKEDIYTFSHVPNLTDSNFAGNSSGVAMGYKLLGLEMLTRIKEKYYRIGLKKRISMFCYFLALRKQHIAPADVTPTFSRSLPHNLLELSQIVNNLSGSVSKQTLLSLLPFVEDPDLEIKAVNEESEEALKRQQEVFKAQASIISNNEQPDDKNND